MSFKTSSYKNIKRCLCGCVINENKEFCYKCLKVKELKGGLKE